MGLFTAVMDSYLEGSIAHLLGLHCSEKQLREKLEQAEQAQRDLQSQISDLQRRLLEAQENYRKAKEEVCSSAQALKRQIAETQHLTESCKLINEDCHQLENECVLYHKDAEIFREVADEAEERATEAENRATEAEYRLDHVVSKLKSLQGPDSLDYQIENSRLAQDLNVLRLKRQKAQADNRRWQNLFDAVKYGSHCDWRFACECASQKNHKETELRADLTNANEYYRSSISELRKVQNLYEEEKACLRDEFAVFSMVNSAVTSAACKALEQEMEREFNAVKLEYEAICMSLEGSFCHKQERLKDTGKCLEILSGEIKELRKNALTYERNLKKAEIEVQVLYEENQTWNRLFKIKHEDLDRQSVSPVHIHRIKCQSGKSSRRHSLGQENSSPILPRQPLTPLRPNLSARRMLHR